MSNIRIEVSDREVNEALARLIDMGEDLDPILNAVGRVIETRITQGFESGTDPYGKAWSPLKTRQGKPLVNTGTAMAQIGYVVEGDSVVVGTNREHMHVHQFGAVIRPKNGKFLVFPGPGGRLIFARQVTIPRRAFLPDQGLPPAWGDDVATAIREEADLAWTGR